MQLFTKAIKREVYTKVIKMPGWMAWVQRPSGLVKAEGSTSALRGNYLGERWECFIEANINHRSKSLWDQMSVDELTCCQLRQIYLCSYKPWEREKHNRKNNLLPILISIINNFINTCPEQKMNII